MAEERPWEAYDPPATPSAAADEERPWEAYGAPTARITVRPAGATAFADRYGDTAPADAAPAAAPADDTGVLSDIDKAIPSGLAQGITGMIGLPGTIGGWARSGASALGVPDQTLDATAK